MIKVVVLGLMCLVLLPSCGSLAGKRKRAAEYELNRPAWVTSRPVNAGYYYGIGISPKKGSVMYYEDRAKERALADMAGQINSSIQTETSYYKVEDNAGVRDYIQSRINASSSEFLEGYEYLEKWEDDNHVYVFYQLSKTLFTQLKAKRKAEALKNAELKYLDAQKMELANEVMPAITAYAEVIDALSGFMDTDNTVLLANQKVDLILASRYQLQALIQTLRISVSSTKLLLTPLERVDEGVLTYSLSNDKGTVQDVPVRFVYSGGYLSTDIVMSDEKGLLASPLFTKSSGCTTEMLVSQIDVLTIGRLATTNIYVRKLIERETAFKNSVTVGCK